jgi:hypothetical protein
LVTISRMIRLVIVGAASVECAGVRQSRASHLAA